MHTPEILAPAGSMESLEAALRCGADAVYAGGSLFSARQNASNFTLPKLEQAVKRCHLYGAKLHLAVNTVIFDSQTEEFAEFVKQAAEIGIDAYIVQDLGAMNIIKEVVSSPVLHASTQMTIHTPHGAEFARSLGFQRVVLARELNKAQIKSICNKNIETEVFVHGALCMSVSGQCYLSSVIGQRSANKGMCAQPCRLPFTSCDRKDSCALSLKDLSLAEQMDELKSLGVTSLKIEGRMKRPEYVAAAVTTFRAAADGNPPDMKNLRAVFSRSGFTDGYFTGNMKNMFGTRKKEDVTSAKDVLPSLRQLYKNERKSDSINFKAEICKDKPFSLTATDGNRNSVTVYGAVSDTALRKSLDIEFLSRQLSKLGETIFTLSGIEAEIEDGLAVSAKDINEVRRNAVNLLSEKRISKNTPIYKTTDYIKKENFKYNKKNISEIRVRISSKKQMDSALTAADKIIIPAKEFLDLNITDFSKIIIEPPRFISDENETCFLLQKCLEKGALNLLCCNPAYIKIGKDIGFKLHGDFGLNITNTESLYVLNELGLESAVLSFEMKLSSIEKLQSEINTGIIAYGHLPVMLMKNCPVKNESGCSNCRKKLTDRTGRTYRVVCHGNYTELLNPECLYMADRLNEIKNVDFLTLYFTDESPEEIGHIINLYKNGGEKRNNITRGLYYRGVLI